MSSEDSLSSLTSAIDLLGDKDILKREDSYK